jgi:RNA polymerase sigma-70 factor (ECF subfamily)
MQRFRHLVDLFGRRIFTLAYYLVGNNEDAEDVAQEVLIRLWNNRDKVDGARLPAWVARVTRNACMDHLRKQRSYRAIVSEQDGEETLSDASDQSPDPRSMLETSDLKGRIEEALGRMEEPYRSVVIMREIQGMAYAEISEALEIPMNTVKTNLHRGRQMLREQLREKVTHERL